MFLNLSERRGDSGRWGVINDRMEKATGAPNSNTRAASGGGGRAHGEQLNMVAIGELAQETLL